MNQYQKVLWFVLRLSMGWIFLYSSVSKLMTPGWTTAGYLNHVTNFAPFFHWLASPSMIQLTDAVNVWGQLVLAVSLILGLGVRYTGVLGAILMILYYLPLPFPHTSAIAYIVDDHIIYALVLLMLSAVGAGKIWGLDRRFGFAK